jgi:hypothetical protein
VQWYLNVLGIERSVIVAVAGWNWEERWIDADKMFQDAATASADRFWQHLQADKKPDWDGSDSTYQTVRELHPDIEDVSVEIDGAHQIAKLNDEFNAAKENLTKAKSQLLDAMGKAKHAHILVNGKEIRIASRQARGEGVPFLVIRS